MTTRPINMVDRQGVDNIIINPSSYVNSHGASMDHFFKAYTTDPLITGKPHYEAIPTGGLLGSQAISSGLRPFGHYTQYEGLIHGSSGTANLNENINTTGVRTYGLKNPMTLVGWGYDIFGFPSPNRSAAYDASGIFAGTGIMPSSTFLGSGGYAQPGVLHGSQVPPNYWHAGPLDVRWDPHRKVWTNSFGIIPVRISGIRVSGGSLSTEANFPYAFTYDIEAVDGGALSLIMTGMLNYGPRFGPASAKVYPLPTGSQHFLMPVITATGVTYGLWGVEMPGVTGCDVASTGNGLIEGGSLVAASASGGTGYSTYAELETLIGVSGRLGRYKLTAGSGITFQYTLQTLGSNFYIHANTSGFATINVSGQNTDIQELRGLVVPLSISGGGTGSNTKNFMDLTTSQIVVSGLKQFNQGIRLTNGSGSAPSLSFVSGSTVGLFYSTGIAAMVAVNSGYEQYTVGTSGVHFKHHVLIRNSAYQGEVAPLRVYGHTLDYTGGGRGIIDWYAFDGTLFGYADITGRLYTRYLRTSGGGNEVPIITTLVSGHTLNSFEIHNTGSNNTLLFGIGSRGNNILIGPSGNRTELLNNVTGSIQIRLPSNSGTLALLTDITGGGVASSSTGGNKISFTFASGAMNFTGIHNFSTRDILVQMYNTVTLDQTDASVNYVSTSGITVSFNSPIVQDVRCTVLYSPVSKVGFTLASGGTTFPCIHNLETRDVLVQLYQTLNNYNQTIAGINYAGTSGIIVTFNSAISGDVRCVVMG